MNLAVSRKIKFDPPTEAKEIILRWIHYARLVYNLSVDIVNKYEQRDRNIVFDVIEEQYSGEKKKSENTALLEVIRHRYRSDLGTDKWKGDVPRCVYDNAARRIIKAKFSDDCSRWNGNQKGERTFKKKTEKDQFTIEIDKREWNGGTFKSCVLLKSLIGDIDVFTESFPDQTETAVEISMDRNKQFWLCESEEGEQNIPTLSGGHHYTCALDPGEKFFNTVYDADGQFIHYASRDDFIKTIMPTLERIDKLQSKMSKEIFKRGQTRNGKKKVKLL